MEPLIGGKQLIGDDFFMQLAEWKFTKIFAGCRNSYGTVQSGATIAQARTSLAQISSMSEKLVICLGAVDIIKVKIAISDHRKITEKPN